jgi:hypothetical protein
MASSTCRPMIVRPVRNATPASAPTSAVVAMATNRWTASAVGTMVSPAATMATPNSRLCGIRLASCGANAMPIPSPTNTETNSMP